LKIIDLKNKQSISKASLYLTGFEAKQMKAGLDALLKDPESFDHSHVYSEDQSSEISFSIITRKKLSNLSKYNELEKKVLGG